MYRLNNNACVIPYIQKTIFGAYSIFIYRKNVWHVRKFCHHHMNISIVIHFVQIYLHYTLLMCRPYNNALCTYTQHIIK